jgi:large subunit ribosomal protein L13
MTDTFFAKRGQVERKWLLVDAAGQPLGRVASRVAALLRGKHKPTYTPHVDTGDHVIVINAAQVVLTADKARTKLHYTHSGWPGGFKARQYGDLLARQPDRLFRQVVRGMLPHNTLGKLMLRKLKVYPGSDHPHAAQKPEPFESGAQ